jgi:hypothetical protein
MSAFILVHLVLVLLNFPINSNVFLCDLVKISSGFVLVSLFCCGTFTSQKFEEDCSNLQPASLSISHSD